MSGWNVLIWLHLLAMAFFVGGQLFMAGVAVPVLRDEASRERLRAAARRFGVGTGIAFLVLIVTGSLLAGHLNLWSDPKLHVKLTLFAVVVAMIAWHMRRPEWHWLEGLVFLLSLAIVMLGVELTH